MSELEEVEKPDITGPFHETTSPREEEPHLNSTEEDLKAKQEWMDVQLQRRLNGEYETMGRRLEEIVRVA